MASQDQVLDQLKWVTGELRKAQATIRAHEAAAREPIAVVGVGCRFPGGVHGPEDLWSVVAEARDVTGDVPAARGWDAWAWFHPDPDHAGTSYVRRGGFLDDAEMFDPGPFGLAPREALAMDPQQRLLLETSWEALERAGIDPGALAGSDTGVFTGIAYNGYGAAGPHGGEHTGHGLTGSSPAIAAGRVAYTLGLHGPAVSLDTMCSSSLVAVHQACRSLRAGECHTALAAGATVIADPTEFVEFSRQRALSTDGRCRPFSADADGTAWGEGIGVLVLEPLSQARREGRPIWAVLRGSAINSDGRSNGLTAPNGAAQRAVLTAALAAAGVRPDQVDMVEAHGTGTRLGDPIEVHALQAVYGRARGDDPVRLGSVKSNLGHTQAAGGMAGVIKTIMAMRHGRMPRSLHLGMPSTEVDWEGTGVAVLDDVVDWAPRGGTRFAAVSAFGASGTNAHVVLEQAPDVGAGRAEPRIDDGPVAWPLSALTGEALAAQARRLADALPALLADATPRQVGSALARRHGFAERAVVVGTADRLPAALDALAVGGACPSEVVAGTAPGRGAPRVLFVFPGQGGQWVGMGAALLGVAPAFTEALAACEEALAPLVGWSVSAVLRGDPDAPALERVDVVQPCLWAMNVALAAEWRARGLEPSAVVGHSQGEVAAAVVAGAVTVADGARVVARRSALVAQRLAGRGAMASLRATAPERDALLAAEPGVTVAARTSPTSVVISGDTDAVDRVVAAAPDHARRIDVDYASHSAHVDAIRDDLDAALVDLPSGRTADVALYSTVTGGLLRGDALTAAHWWENLRRPVRFDDAVRTALADGHTLVVEVSTHPVLTAAVAEIADGVDGASGGGVAVLETLRRDAGGPADLLRAMAAAWTHGAPVTPTDPGDGADPAVGALAARLPTYAFRRTPFWITPSASGDAADPLRLDERWVPLPAPAPGAPELVLVPDDTSGPGLAAAAAAAWPSAAIAAIPLDAPCADALDAALADRSGATVLSLLGAGGGAGAALAATLTLLQRSAVAGVAVRVVTRDALRVDGADADDGARGPLPDRAALWGLVRTAALETPAAVDALVDLPATDDLALAGAVLPAGEDEVAVRAGAVLARRLVPAPLTTPHPREPAATVIVTGATGALGGEVARRLAERGVRRLLLPTRRDRDDPRVRARCAELAERGAQAVWVRCDLGVDDDVAALARSARDGRGEEAAVHAVHAALPATTGPLDTLTAAELDAAVDLALGGARRLRAALGDDATLTTFASVTGLWGAAGHAAMATPGPALAAFAAQERAAGRATTALSWGVWRVADPAHRADGVDEPARHGLPPLDPGAAMAAWERVADGLAGAAIVDVDLPRFLALYAARRPTRRFDLLEGPSTDGREAGPESAEAGGRRPGAALRDRVAGLPAADRSDAVLAAVRDECAQVLGHGTSGADDVPPDRALRELGFDSLMGVDLRNRLQDAVGTALRATVVFDFPTPRALAGHLGEVLDELLEGGGGPGPATAVATVARVEALLLGGHADAGELPGLVRRLEDAIDAWRRSGTGRHSGLSDVPGGADLAGLDGPPEDDDEALLTFIQGQLESGR